MYEFYKNIEINGLRFPKVFRYKKYIYIIGGELFMEEGVIKKYNPRIFELDNDLKINIDSRKIFNFNNIVKGSFENLYISYWCRDVYQMDDWCNLLIEFKTNHNNKTYTHEYYLLKTQNFEDFQIIKKFDDKYKNSYIFKTIDGWTLTSLIIPIDNFYWGKYQFQFFKDNKKINPVFDTIVKYNINQSHVLHNIIYEERDKKYKILFTIRHYIETKKEYKYEIYQSESKDMVNFTNTKLLDIERNFDNAWYSYPSVLTHNGIDYLICNGDDFGKIKKPLIFFFK